jgi:tetratricopeptide (TPR) repeat protein
MKIIGALVAITVLLLALPSRAADFIAIFDQGNRLYEQGKFREAATAYQQLLSAGQVSATVYYNLGNAWFKAGQPGRAVAAWRRAQELAPRDPNVRFNLNFARKQVTGSDTPPSDAWKRWFGRLTVNEWTLVAAVLFWLWFALLILREVRPSLRPSLRTATIVAAIAAIVSMARVGFVTYYRDARREAVVIVPQTVVRLGPLEDSRVYYQLRDGSEIVVLDEKRLNPNESWLQVRDGSRRVGWLKRDQVAVL